MLITLTVLMAVCAITPAILFVANLKHYLPPKARHDPSQRVSVLIPARNEEENIAECIQHVLSSQLSSLEVIILDDASTDRTAAIVQEFTKTDPRVRLLSSIELPAGWNGKQHACWQIAQASTAPDMLFLDADVRLHPSAIGDCVVERRCKDVALLSGFPRQITVGWMEWLLLPLIHFVLLGFLPLVRMRSSTDPALAAGCGQFMLVDREAYFAIGGHAAIRTTMHDGLLLPRAFRVSGFRTDLVDLTHLAKVRMYDSTKKVWEGLAKNATEGIAAPKRIVPISLVLVLGQVCPTVFVIMLLLKLIGEQGHQPLICWTSHGSKALDIFLFLGFAVSYLPRVFAVRRFKQPLKSALLHPLGITVLLCIQWYALLCQLMGKPIGWRQRKYIRNGMS